MIEKVISGGQTGVDHLAWVAAKSFGISTGGWMPKGFLTEQGYRPNFAKVWGAWEHEDFGYPLRTRANVAASDMTLVMGSGRGACLTLSAAKKAGVKVIHVPQDSLRAANWTGIADSIVNIAPRRLNVAGSRASRMSHAELKLVERILIHVFRRFVFVGFYDIPDLHSVDEDEAGEVGARVSGQCVCEYCLRKYVEHPQDQTRVGMNEFPYLNVLCDGRVVKL